MRLGREQQSAVQDLTPNLSIMRRTACPSSSPAMGCVGFRKPDHSARERQCGTLLVGYDPMTRACGHLAFSDCGNGRFALRTCLLTRKSRCLKGRHVVSYVAHGAGRFDDCPLTFGEAVGIVRGLTIPGCPVQTKTAPEGAVSVSLAIRVTRS